MSTNQNLDDLLRQMIIPIVNDTVREAIKAQLAPRSKAADNEKELLGVKEAASFLGLSVQTIYGHTSRNEIPHFKRGKKLYFRQTELVRWIEEGKRKTRAELGREADLYLSKKRGA